MVGFQSFFRFFASFGICQISQRYYSQSKECELWLLHKLFYKGINYNSRQHKFVKEISRHEGVKQIKTLPNFTNLPSFTILPNLTILVNLTILPNIKLPNFTILPNIKLPNFTTLPNFTLPNFTTSGLSLLQFGELCEQVRADQWRTGSEGLMVCDNSPRSAYHAPTSSNYPKVPTGHSSCTCWHTGSLHNTLEINTPTLPLSHGTGYRLWG